MEPVNNSQQVSPPPVAPVINPTPPLPSPERKRGKLGKIIALVIILFLLSVSAVAGFVIYKNLNKQPEQVACTLEAMICPDGSSVGRTGPNCEFSPCPSAPSDPTTDWETISLNNTNVVFSYPSSWNASEIKKSESDNYFIDLKGLGSEIQITWDGEGYGGGCSIEDKKGVQILDSNYELCHSQNETDEFISAIFATDEGTPISFTATAKPNSADINTIYQILSTFTFD